MGLRKKVLLLYAGIAVLILILVGGILWSKLQGDRFAAITSDVDRQLTYLDFALTNFMTEVENDVRALSENELVRTRNDVLFTSFINTNETTFRYDIGEVEKGIIDVLNAYRISHSYVNSVYMGRENGSFVRSHPRSQPTQYDPRERPWYTLAKENPGSVVRTEPYQSVTTADVNIGVVTALLDENGQVYGVVGSDITLTDLTDYISDFDVGYGGQLLLTDSNGVILAARDEEMLFSDLQTSYGEKLADFIGDNDDVIKIGDTHYFIHRSPSLDWNIIALVPSSYINRQILSSVFSPLLGLSMALALLSGLTILGLNSFVIKPIRNLSETTRHIARTGDLAYQIDVNGSDEIGSLATSFSHMIEAIGTKESDLVESEIKFRNLFDSSRDAIVLSTADGFIDCNQAALEMFGYQHKPEFTRMNMADVSPARQPDGRSSSRAARGYIDQAYVGDGILFEWVFQRQDRSIFPAEVLLNPTEMYGALVIQGVIRDITDRKKSQAKLAHEHAFMRSLLDSVPDVIFVKDKEGIYINCNRAYEAFGWNEKELIGKTDDDLFPPEQVELYRDADAEVIEKGVSIKYEEWKELPDGRRLLFETVKTPYRGPNDEVIGVIGISRDITDHREIEEEVRALNVELEERVRIRTEELTKFSLAIEHSPASVMITNVDGEIEYINPKFAEITEYSSDEVIGKNPRFLQSGEHKAEFYEDIWETITSGYEWTGEICNRKKSGELFWELGSISPILNEEGEITHFVSIREDITDRKRMEEELLIAKEKAEDATQAKGEFLANMSHEIRTPMNAVIGMTHLALQTEVTKQQQDYLEKINTSAHSLLGIINDILDFSKIEAGRLDIESVPFDLNEVLENLATLINFKAEEKDLEIIFAIDPDVPTNLVGDPLRLEQVLVNLGSNAVKFTDEGEVVFAGTVLSERDDQVTLQFTVQDTGVGMTDEQRSRLFQAFSQADTSITRKYGGTGLGLAISKQLVELMEGEIWVESQPEIGSEFIFTAVFQRAEQQQPSPILTADELRKLKVLVVDDNPTARDTLKGYLETLPVLVSTSDSGKDSLEQLSEAAQADPYNLVVLDWKMPKLDGIEVARRIKENPDQYQDPLIIMVSAFGREEIVAQANELDLDGFLIKPFSQSTLLDAIMSALGKDLPRDTTSKLTDEWMAGDGENLSGARILLVEDIEINQEVVTGLLSPLGITLDVANNGEEALQKVSEKDYDAILMDVQMPVMDGYEATQHLREEERLEDLPIIAMTANAMAGDYEKSLQAGMNDHIVKPIDPKELISKLNQWIGAGKGTLDLPLAGLQGISADSGLGRVNGDQELYREILFKFFRDYRDVGERISEALKSNGKEDARHLVHEVKGVAGNIGAEELHTRAGKLEKVLANDSKQAGYKKALKKFDKALQIVLESLATFFDALEQEDEPEEQDSTQTSVGDPSDLMALLDELEPHIQKRKPIPSKSILDKIKDTDWPEEFNEELAELDKLIKEYKFKPAMEVLEALLNKGM